MSKKHEVQGTESMSEGNSPQTNHNDDLAYGIEHAHTSVGVPLTASDPAHKAASKKVTDRAKQRWGKSINTSSSTSKTRVGAYGEK